MIDSGFGFFLTNDAFNKICALRSKREIPVALRMSVVGGGCSGFQYVFLMEEVGRNKKEGEGLMSDKELEENFEDEDDFEDEDGFGDEDDFDEDFDEVGDFDEDFDENFDDDEVELHDADGNMFFVTDKASVRFLKGATVDYTQNLIGSGFSVRNPNATARCGCGNSFSV